MRGHGAAEDAFRGGLPAQPPLCPNHGIPMTLQG
jgi:hypothetical protein